MDKSLYKDSEKVGEKRIQVSHEVPLSLLGFSREFNDYDYALVHLFPQYPEYLQFFKASLMMGRRVILDNSIFELGESVSFDVFARAIEDLQPTEYIIPDSLEDCLGTISKADNWMKDYAPNLPGKPIAVIQGKNLYEFEKCYSFFNSVLEVPKIAISFDYSWYQEAFPHPNKLVSWMMGRLFLVSHLNNQGFLNKSKPHHLLGCSLPQEFAFYKPYELFSFIDTLDTSNPVTTAYNDEGYDFLGLTKPAQRLVDIFEEVFDGYQLVKLQQNTSSFKDLL